MDPSFERRLESATSGPFSPSQLPLRNYGGDRFIPVRNVDSWSQHSNISPNSEKKMRKSISKMDNEAYSCLLRSELLSQEDGQRRTVMSSPSGKSPYSKESRNIFQYRIKNSPSSASEEVSYSLSPLANKSQCLLYSLKARSRKISTFPYKVLDAPGLEDDFYLNLLDWSSQNMVAIGLNSKVYLWDAFSCEIFMCSDLSTTQESIVTSLSFNENGNYLAMGTNLGHIHIWDVQTNKIVSSQSVHYERIGSLHWNRDMLVSGSKDRSIIVTDTRTKDFTHTLEGHKQEVCGVKWSHNKINLASGSNDNRILIWDPFSSRKPIHSYTQHKAAVKALAWSPHQHGLLASGGGTADQTLRVWNTLLGDTESVQCVDVKSQVCALAWSKHRDELISTHGYSMNEILLWTHPKMKQMARLTGHTRRVLYLSMSPDGQSIVTGAGDETLRFWSIFPKSKSKERPESPLNMFNRIR